MERCPRLLGQQEILFGKGVYFLTGQYFGKDHILFGWKGQI